MTISSEAVVSFSTNRRLKFDVASTKSLTLVASMGTWVSAVISVMHRRPTALATSIESPPPKRITMRLVVLAATLLPMSSASIVSLMALTMGSRNDSVTELVMVGVGVGWDAVKELDGERVGDRLADAESVCEKDDVGVAGFDRVSVTEVDGDAEGVRDCDDVKDVDTEDDDDAVCDSELDALGDVLGVFFDTERERLSVTGSLIDGDLSCEAERVPDSLPVGGGVTVAELDWDVVVDAVVELDAVVVGAGVTVADSDGEKESEAVFPVSDLVRSVSVAEGLEVIDRLGDMVSG